MSRVPRKRSPAVTGMLVPDSLMPRGLVDLHIRCIASLLRETCSVQIGLCPYCDLIMEVLHRPAGMRSVRMCGGFIINVPICADRPIAMAQELLRRYPPVTHSSDPVRLIFSEWTLCCRFHVDYVRQCLSMYGNENYKRCMRILNAPARCNERTSVNWAGRACISRPVSS